MAEQRKRDTHLNVERARYDMAHDQVDEGVLPGTSPVQHASEPTPEKYDPQNFIRKNIHNV